MQLGPAEVLVVLVIALLVFGPNKLPQVGRQVGRALKEFRHFQQTMSRDMSEVFSDDASTGAEPPPTLPPKVPTIDAQSSEVSAPEVSASGVSSTESPGESATDPEASA